MIKMQRDERFWVSMRYEAERARKRAPSTVSRAHHALCLDALEHLSRGLPDAHGVAAECVSQRRADRACTGEESVSGRIRAVLIGREEVAAFVPEEVVERLGELRVVHGRVKSGQHGANAWVGCPVLETEWRDRVVLGVLRAQKRTRTRARAHSARGDPMQKQERNASEQYTISSIGWKQEGKTRTVPPRYSIPSSLSSSSSPAMPTTYTFLSFGSCRTEEMYTADAYADPKISSYTAGAREVCSP